VIDVAPATRADVPAVYALMRGLAVYEKLEHAFVATEADLERALFGEHPACEALVGRLDDRPVGYALFFPTYSTFLGKTNLWLEDLFVLPEARGNGLGKALLARVAALVVERGGGRLEWVVLDWNEPSIEFYKSLGATALDDWLVYRLSGDALAALAGTSSAPNR
jgi:GNAT superfamily N-acetyltransferase